MTSAVGRCVVRCMPTGRSTPITAINSWRPMRSPGSWSTPLATEVSFRSSGGLWPPSTRMSILRASMHPPSTIESTARRRITTTRCTSPPRSPKGISPAGSWWLPMPPQERSSGCSTRSRNAHRMKAGGSPTRRGVTGSGSGPASGPSPRSMSSSVALLQHSQSESPVRRLRSARGEPVHQLDDCPGPGDRRAQVVLPDDPSRPLGLGQRHRPGPLRRHAERRDNQRGWRGRQELPALSLASRDG